MTLSSLRSRIELHVHIDGAVRLSTIWELSKAKSLPLPGDGSFQAFIDTVVSKDPSNLPAFLRGFSYILPALVGDLKAIERVAYELCADQASNGLIYFEGRYSPHLLSKGDVTPNLVVEAVNKGLKSGQNDFKIKARSILCCIVGKPEWCSEIVQLCDKYRDHGVVGIDIAGDETLYGHGTDVHIPQEYIDAFLEAEKKGIHRTMHAGEAGSYVVVEKALHDLHAQRIGHGYHVLENKNLYEETLSKQVHFEMCPRSSLLTGAVTETTLTHPIIKFANDGANFSINTDDPAITGTWLPNEIELTQRWGFNEVHFTRAAFNAARSCFLPDNEKKELLQKLQSIYIDNKNY